MPDPKIDQVLEKVAVLATLVERNLTDHQPVLIIVHRIETEMKELKLGVDRLSLIVRGQDGDEGIRADVKALQLRFNSLQTMTDAFRSMAEKKISAANIEKTAEFEKLKNETDKSISGLKSQVKELKLEIELQKKEKQKEKESALSRELAANETKYKTILDWAWKIFVFVIGCVWAIPKFLATLKDFFKAP